MPAAAQADSREDSHMPMRIAVTSGKGGVGKTSVSVNLSICFARRGLRTLLVDVDVGMANADLMLGVQPRYSLANVLLGERTVEEVLVDCPDGALLLPGISHASGEITVDRERCNRLVQLLDRRDDDVQLLDCGGGIGTEIRALAPQCQKVLVVTMPEPTALTDAYATIKTLIIEGYRGSVHVVLNRVDSRADAEAAFTRLSRVCENFLNFPIADAGYILHDDYVEYAVRQRTPFTVRYPRCSAGVCLDAVAARLAPAVVNRTGERKSLFKRVAGLFS